MSYKLEVTPEADKDLIKLKRNEPLSYKKALKLLDELEIHPTIGTGHPKQLSEDKAGQWSRRITEKHRLVYKVHEEIITVLVLSAYGHYDDK
jgi:toxin YoeB